ncbi:hypothetical protein Sjap_005632 [Stephania japonica]|uniref:ERCC1-like central domain-containing protein n=1 Tax=Stephania japonica TaxID=461633 RepID=A0AAP0K638_9MAGN
MRVNSLSLSLKKQFVGSSSFASSMEAEAEQTQNKNKKKKHLIEIPSFSEVIKSSQPKPPPSLFTPSPSFSQAFSFVKNTEFYTAPDPPPIPRQTVQSEASSSSSSLASSGSAIQSRNAILVSHRQKGNPLLKHIRNVKWVFADVVCDYLLGQTSCALYIRFFNYTSPFYALLVAVDSYIAGIGGIADKGKSVILRYHLLHPDYLYFRIRELQKNFKLRVVLCHVDVEDVIKPLHEVTRTALLHDCTLLCAWSLEECGRYLETIKVYENKPADILQGQTDTDYLSRLNHAITSVRSVNKTDVVNLGSSFGSLSRIMDASMEELAHCPGIGERKVKRLYDTFHEPFKRKVPIRSTATPQAPLEENVESSSADNKTETDQKIDGDITKQKKESSVTVKSALTTAFAKYSERLGKRKQTADKCNETADTSLDVKEKDNKSD